MQKIKLLLLSFILLLSTNSATGFSTHEIQISRAFDPMQAPVGGSVTVAIQFMNQTAHDMRGFYYTESIPVGLSVHSKNVTINGVSISGYKTESGNDGDITPGYIPCRWILETPPLFKENNPLPAGAELKISYTISTSQAGSFSFESFNWVANIQGLAQEEQAVFGYNEDSEKRTITFVTNGIVAVNDIYAVEEGGNIIRQAPGILENDTGGNPLTAVLVTDVTNGTLSLSSDGSLGYTHDGSETTSDSFTYHATGINKISNLATVIFTITPINDFPFAGDDTARARINESVIINVSDNDTDADGHLDPTSITIKNNPSHGKAQSNPDGAVTYTPDADFAGTDTFTYVFKDDQGALSNVAVVKVIVNPPTDDGKNSSSGGGCFIAIGGRAESSWKN